MIPLALKLKKELHRRIALAQDLLVSELYAVFNEAVLHGGTAIWRCYKGNRFSEDVDVYIQRDVDKINLLFRNLEKKGFIIEKKKVGEKSLYSSLRLDRTYIRFEALFKKSKGELGEYETADGNLITVYTLTPEEFVSEKVDTYLKRSGIRDLYDIFFLLRYVKDTNKVKNRLQAFAGEFKKPVDEKELKVLVIEGIVPTAEKMLEYIKRKL
jgi:predicted nucleotidyltransferase component of viral defense system